MDLFKPSQDAANAALAKQNASIAQQQEVAQNSLVEQLKGYTGSEETALMTRYGALLAMGGKQSGSPLVSSRSGGLGAPTSAR